MKTNFMSLNDKTKVIKETVFTSFVATNSISTVTPTPNAYKNVLHIGYDKAYGDVFKCWDNDINSFYLYFGIAGDEFKSPTEPTFKERVMWVWDGTISNPKRNKRVVFMKKDNTFLAYSGCETLEEINRHNPIISWTNAEDIN